MKQLSFQELCGVRTEILKRSNKRNIDFVDVP